MLGAIIGDIVGSRFEFDQVPEEGFELFTDDCSFTDDTICTVAIADAILNGRSYKDSLIDWCHRYPNPMGGYGTMFHQWVMSANPLPVASYGNGSAMRVSPVGWLFDEYREVLDQAKQSAECSHCHSEGVKGAQCVAVVIYWLRTCRLTREEIEGAVVRNFGYDIPPLSDINRIGKLGHFDSTCQETVPWALRCFLESDNFEDAIRKAVMARGDTDTKGAITGSMAEAYFHVPVELAEKAFRYLPKDILDIVDQYYTHMTESVMSE
jgi:ADP-ribosylglycohydrolase